MKLTELAGRRVVVWGTGREAVAALRAIAPLAPAELLAVQDGPAAPAGNWAELAGSVPLVTGADAQAAILAAEVLVRSPGVAQTHPWLAGARAAGVRITGGTALWMPEHAARTIGVTGSKGKSTTSTLISRLLAAVGRPNVLGGNIGTAALALPEAELYVLELSMYQCADLDDSPRTAVLTSLYPEHLDWSGGEREYYRDKLNLVAHGPERVVFNAGDPRLTAELAAFGPDLPRVPVGSADSFHVAAGSAGEPWFYLGAEPLFPRTALGLVGRHNASNLCVALGALQAVGVDCLGQRDALAEGLAGIRPLEHRLTPIPDPSGLTFVDDSISTIPESAIHAIEAYAHRPLTVIVGGQDRGLDYRPLRDYLAATGISATLIGIPDSGERILQAVADLPAVLRLSASDLTAAVRLARRHTPPGGVVLLSPAAPSYGRFDNFEHRSRVFAEAIAATAPAGGGATG
ncbi:UDP-N-acetylmuramoyl-L-alanine--D-glutamate ligase [Jatrophihabitans sp.]|uniref:UDP-N-acetylmuramoyl-L-alanine--D-glutamate ligase n=1 Tax=Jatrophihabitans sp. TaxID=1932789 RepID=UPI002C76C192|nr:UDP-N-acetylmuramoyl-L-alanine--D-glutamate ligase [Jatrophihabitans sp.]